MRISDWSSDVCSSDLRPDHGPAVVGAGRGAAQGCRVPYWPRSINMTMRWYVVHAYSQYETSVMKALKERINRAGLQEQFGDILVPTEEVVEITEGVKRTTERKFFPGYVLVQMDRSEEHTSELHSLIRITYAVFCWTQNHT